MVGPACVPKIWPETHQRTSFAGLLRLCLEVAVFSTGWGLGWKQVISDEVALSPVGCWIRVVQTD